MTVDLGAVSFQAGQFRGCEQDIRTAINQLRAYQDRVNMAWSGAEMYAINQEIDHICMLLTNAVQSIGGLADDVRRAGGAAKRAEEAAKKGAKKR